MIRKEVYILMALSVLSLTAGCSKSDRAVTALPTQIYPTVDSFTGCPTARGIGTIEPAISIYSITFRVNDNERVVYDGDMLRAVPGDEVQVAEVVICVGSFSGNGGEACVDFAPVDQSGQEIMSEHNGTHLVQVTPGLSSISNLDFTWTISENWSGIAAVLNHWTPENTRDSDCSSGRCERDDWLTVDLR